MSRRLSIVPAGTWLHRLAAPGILTVAGALGACSTLPEVGLFGHRDGAPAYPVDVSAIPDAVPRVEPRSKYGNPVSYTVRRKRYYILEDNRGYVARGIASWYGTKFHGRRTSSGEPYNMYAMTAAHRTLPLPTYAEVTNLRNGRSVIVKINDRGPFKDDRLIDLSYAAAARLGITATGTGRVEVRAIDPATYHAPAAAAGGDDARPPASGAAGVYLQIGAFSRRESAERLRARLDAVTPPDSIRIIPVERARQTLYRVRIGPLPDLKEADRVSRRLVASGLDEPRLVID